MKKLSLNGSWDLYFFEQKNIETSGIDSFDKNNVYHVPAEVPGNVELDLSQNGFLPEDLFKGFNILELKKYENYEWWYEREFDAPEIEEGKKAFLRFAGVDTLAEYWLNGEKIGESDNMFIPIEFEVTDKLLAKNKLTVRIRSVMREAYSKDYSMYSLDGNWAVNSEAIHIRKAPHSFGWDIFPRAVTSGLWRDVDLVIKNECEISQLFCFCNELTEKKAQIKVNYILETDNADGLMVEVFGKCEDSEVYQKEKVKFKAGAFYIDVANPKMWWPYGYGEAKLYDITVRFSDGDTVVAEEKLNMGLRTVELRKSDFTDGENGEFCFYINNVPVMCKGSNWVPMDVFHSRDKQRYQKALELVKDIGCNILRCWGGNVYEDKEFYDFCDENGIMVWQDFSMACNSYPQDEIFRKKLYHEASEIIKMLRQHPSVILWSGDNECDVCLNYNGIDPNENVLTRNVLKKAVVENDVRRPYLPSSPYMSPIVFEKYKNAGLPENHLWGPRDYFKSDFYTNYKAHFVSEMGYHGCPSRKSIEKFIDEDYIWPIENNDQWNLHSTDVDFKDARVMLMARQIKQLFGNVPDNLDDFAFASQISQAEAKKFFIENIRVKREHKSGIIWWNLIDGWPQMSDAVVDYYYEKKIAYDYIKRSQQPFALMCSEISSWNVNVIASNDTLNPVSGKFKVKDIETGKILLEGEFNTKPNSNENLGQIPVMYSDKGVFLIEWEVDGKRYFNHYMYGMPGYDLEKYKEWFGKIK